MSDCDGRFIPQRRRTKLEFCSLTVVGRGAALNLRPADADGWLIFHPRGTQFRHGRNELSFQAAEAKADSGKLADVLHVELSVMYKQ